MLVVEEEVQALALQDERIERRKDMHSPVRSMRGGERLPPRPVLEPAGAFYRDPNQLAAPRPRADQRSHRRLARCVQMTRRVEADQALRAQRAVEQIVENLASRGGLRQLFPTEVPGGQFVGLQHAGPLADYDEAAVEGELQRTLRRLAAAPCVAFVDQ